MATALDIITRAHRLLGVSGQGEALEAEMAADGLTALNAMLPGWRLRGVNISGVDANGDPLPYTALTQGSTFPLAAHFEDATAHCLAAALAPLYAVAVPFDADDHFRAIQAAYLVIAPVVIPAPLTTMPSARRWTV